MLSITNFYSRLHAHRYHITKWEMGNGKWEMGNGKWDYLRLLKLALLLSDVILIHALSFRVMKKL